MLRFAKYQALRQKHQSPISDARIESRFDMLAPPGQLAGIMPFSAETARGVGIHANRTGEGEPAQATAPLVEFAFCSPSALYCFPWADGVP